MIRIYKPEQPPAVLLKTGKSRTTSYCTKYMLTPQEYKDGSKGFSFDNKIYGHKDVKEILKKAQNLKCCFCETIIGDDGDVEHFRPKSAYKQRAEDDYMRPGYYWLAYDWSNLFFSCLTCNQRYKKNLFPLVDPANRAHDHTHVLTKEEPLLIDPAKINPEEFITFRKEEAIAINDNPYGKATIEVIGLNRPGLREMRREKLKILKTLYEMVLTDRRINSTLQKKPDSDKSDYLREIRAQLQSPLESAKAMLSMSVQANWSFAAMFRAAEKNGFWVDQDASAALEAEGASSEPDPLS